MNKDYLIAKVTDKNRILAELRCNIFGVDTGHRAVLDTGCSMTTIPFRRIFEATPKVALKHKKKDILAGTGYLLSYGVESSGTPHTKPDTLEEKLECGAMKFEHMAYEMTLNGYSVGNQRLYINYDRVGNILIGMDILRQFELHFGEALREDEKDNVHKGEYIILGCLKNNPANEYLGALERYFGTTKTKPETIARLRALGLLQQ